MSQRKPISLADKPLCQFYVYAIYPPGSPLPCYIGKGTKYRFRHYRSHHNVRDIDFKHTIYNLKKEGRECDVQFLYETDDEEDALAVEEFFIGYYGRRVDQSGILYNYSPGNQEILKTGISNRKPVYIKGFIFPSVTQAMYTVGSSKKSIDYAVKTLTGSYLDDPENVEAVSLKEREDRRKLKYQYFYRSRREFFKSAIKKFKNKHEALNRDSLRCAMVVDGVEYKSQKEAALAHGWKKGHSFVRYLERGDHNHTYEIQHGRRKGKNKIKINNIVYSSRDHAVESLGFTSTQCLMDHLKRNTDKYKVIFPYIEETQ